jgi:hypothetical protein
VTTAFLGAKQEGLAIVNFLNKLIVSCKEAKWIPTKQQASKLPVCQHLSTDYLDHYYHGYSSRFLPMAGSRSKGIFTA